MDVSPFPYHGPLEPEQVSGRDDLVADLVERVTEHRVSALLGPRRYGKTSVLRRVAHEVIAGGVAVVWVDLYEVASMADIAARLDAGLARVTGAFADRVSKVAASASLHLGLVSVELRSVGRDRPDPLLTTHALLDEFSGIARVDGAAGLLRTGLQHHFQDLGLIFAGSEPSTMRMLFTDQAEPFYAQADLVTIGPLAAEDVVDIIVDGFAQTGRRAGPVASRVAAFAGGHPQRTMQLADTAWRLVDRGGEASVATWDEALERVRTATADGHERLYSSLQDGEKLVLRVLASGGSIFGSAGKVLDLPTGTAQHARRRLVDRGHLSTDGDRHQVVDPLFADWIARRFPL